MIVAPFNGNPSTPILYCYSSIDTCNETDLITYYDKLSSLVRSFPKHNVLIIGRGRNAQKGKDEIRKFC